MNKRDYIIVWTDGSKDCLCSVTINRQGMETAELVARAGIRILRQTLVCEIPKASIMDCHGGIFVKTIG